MEFVSLCSAHFGGANSSVPIWLDDVECVGTERSIVNCLHSNWTVHDCHHNEDAGVACTSKSVRLCVCMCMLVCLSVEVCMSVYVCLCTYVCMYGTAHVQIYKQTRVTRCTLRNFACNSCVGLMQHEEYTAHEQLLMI